MGNFAVFGHPIKHSLSPQIHQAFAQSCNIKLSYCAIDVAPEQFEQKLTDFFTTANGANITLPFKQQAFTLVQQTSQHAKAAQAINTIKKMADNSLFGDNTDGVGLIEDLTKNLGFNLKDKSILLVGAGGAAKGVLQPLLAQNPAKLVIVNRSYHKAEQLAEQFSQYGNIVAQQLTDCKQVFDLIINASSASLNGELPALNPSIIKPKHSCCYDMMYGKQITLFNQWATQLQAQQTWDGFGMLVEQAAKAFYLWHDILPNTTKLLPILRQQLLK